MELLTMDNLTDEQVRESIDWLRTLGRNRLNHLLVIDPGPPCIENLRLRERIAGAKTIADGPELFADLPERVDGIRRLA